MEVIENNIGRYKGCDVVALTLKNDQGVEVVILTTGATIQHFYVPQPDGNKKDLVLGFDNFEAYYRNSYCMGQTIGRVAGRISGEPVFLEDYVYHLPKNEGEHTLHGGLEGLQHQNWDYLILNDGPEYIEVKLSLHQLEEQDQFPGDMDVEVSYRLDNTNQLSLTFSGKAIRHSTLFNPTNHLYFNLSQHPDLRSHRLEIAADQYLELDQSLLPTGQLLDVSNTTYDFRLGRNLGERIASHGGLDDVFVVSDPADSRLKVIAKLNDEESGDTITVLSDRAGLVIYTLNEVNSDLYLSRDKGKPALVHAGVAMEAQSLPDAIHRPNFGDITLSENQEKTYHIVFQYDNTNH